MPRLGTAISHNQCHCLVIQKTDFMNCLGSDHIENILHFSILKWAFKKSSEFKDEAVGAFLKKFKKEKFNFTLIIQTSFKARELFQTITLYLSRITLINMESELQLIVFQCKPTKSIQSQEMVMFSFYKQQCKNLQENRQKFLNSIKKNNATQGLHLNLYSKLWHISAQQQFKHQNIQNFMHNLLLIKKIKSLQGGKGDIYNVFDKMDCKLYNIRSIKKIQVCEEKSLQKLFNQKTIMQKAKLCKFLSFNCATFHDQFHIFYILKHYSFGSLQNLLQKHKNFRQQITIYLISCIVIGLEFIHIKIEAVHRNLSLQNIFLDDQGYFCIDNFQNSKILNPKYPKTQTIIGTPHYYAPQMINGKGYSFEVDYWSLGVIIYRILYGKFPFTNTSKDPFEIFKHVIKNKLEFKVDPKFCLALIDFTRQLLSSDPQARTKQNKLRNHEILKDINWQKAEKTKMVPPFNIDKFSLKIFDKKFYEDLKNDFSNFIQKQRKKFKEICFNQMPNFKS